MTNRFIAAASRGGIDGFTQNGAISNATSGSVILDYFAKCGTYAARTQAEINADLQACWLEDKLMTLKVIFYNRAISRKCNGFVQETSLQKGQGRKDEFAKSLVWLNSFPEGRRVLAKNLWLVPEVGSWSDLWYDSAANKDTFAYQNVKDVAELIKLGMNNEVHRGLIAKHLPSIRSSGKITNSRQRRRSDYARQLAGLLGWTEVDYRKFKSSPDNTAHSWQRFMTNKSYAQIDWNRIPGKALNKLVNGGVLAARGLMQSYLSWIDKQPVAKFNGYPYELYKSVKESSGKPTAQAIIRTANAQFEGLIKKVKDDTPKSLLGKKVMCALDTSGSMSCGGGAKNASPLDICVGLGIFFSSLIEGSFKDNVIMFDSTSSFKQLKGTFAEKCNQVPMNAMGSTNFQSVIDLIVKTRMLRPEIPIEDYPNVILVVSDMQFNPSNSYGVRRGEMTNHEAAVAKLASVGLTDISFIWWDVNGAYGKDVPSTINDKGTTLISGFDPSVVNLILGNDVVDESGNVVKDESGNTLKLNPHEQMVKALDQMVLNALTV